MRNPSTMSSRIRIPIYNRRPYRDCFSQLLYRRNSTWYLLCCSPFPLRSFHGSSLRHICRLYPLIPIIFRDILPPFMIKGAILHNVYRSKPDIFPPTLPRTSRNATPIYWLPRRLHHMKNSLLYRIYDITRRSHPVSILSMRSFHCPTKSNSPSVHRILLRMTI